MNSVHVRYLKEAVRAAQRAKKHGCVPIGAVIVKNHHIIADAYNKKDKVKDATAHAEIMAIRRAGKTLGPNLDGCTLYSTLKPCLMCLAACYWAHITKVIYMTDYSDKLQKYFETKPDMSNEFVTKTFLRHLTIKQCDVGYEIEKLLV